MWTGAELSIGLPCILRISIGMSLDNNYLLKTSSTTLEYMDDINTTEEAAISLIKYIYIIYTGD